MNKLIKILILHKDSINKGTDYLPRFYKRFPQLEKWNKKGVWKLHPAKIDHGLKSLTRHQFSRIYYNTDQIGWEDLAEYVRTWPSALVFGFSLDPNKKEKNSTMLQTKINKLRKDI